MTMNNTQTGQPTPIKNPSRIAQCSLIIANMRKVLTKASANCAEHHRINKPLVTHGLANQKIRHAGGSQAVFAASEARFQAQLQAGI